MTPLAAFERSTLDSTPDSSSSAVAVELGVDRVGDRDTHGAIALDEWDYDTIAIEDDEPVDSLISEKQQRLSVNSAYSSYAPGVPFLVAANVGLFYDLHRPPIVPDVMLSLNVEVPEDWREKKNRSYFVPVLGKPPELAIEIVSNQKGNELGSKLLDYARAGVLYYVVFDPLKLLGDRLLQAFELRNGQFHPLPEAWFERLQLGLRLWEGAFEQRTYGWLRWYDPTGNLLLTGDERADQAEQAQRAESQRADAAEQREQAARQRAEEAERRAAELAERLRALGEG